jgi:hypothetical protein
MITIKFKIRDVSIEMMDKIYSDMIGAIGGNMLDIHVKDIYLNDDNSADFFILPPNVELEVNELVQGICETIQDADNNLHKIILRYVGIV